MKTVKRNHRVIEEADWATKSVSHSVGLGDWFTAHIMRTGVEGEAGLHAWGHIRIGRLSVGYTYEDEYEQPHEANISWNLGDPYSSRSLRLSFSWPRRA